ncbi:MAG: hypothetical protein KKG93_18965 [Bacteroidetes bacterium]|nr:hypothetical protein [Bacteroidota bacterium]
MQRLSWKSWCNAAPGVKSISHVCGTCHLHNMEYFESSDMASSVSQEEFHSREECHGNHNIEKSSDNMIGEQEG